ncbi:MAG TPA: hypothetical protein VNQ73_10150 [Ilumatobacter sp.]|nr:hypothetical protein [Ilumatobacter sp.]
MTSEAVHTAQRNNDAGREALYAAELAAFDGTAYEAIVPLAELRDLAAQIFRAGWWPVGPVGVVAARADAESSSTRQRGRAGPVVRLAAGQCTPATLVHELAHVLAGVPAGHGPRYRRAYLDLVSFCWGDTAAGWLRTELEAARLAVGERDWPAPPVAPGPSAGPIAL